MPPQPSSQKSHRRQLVEKDEAEAEAEVKKEAEAEQRKASEVKSK